MKWIIGRDLKWFWKENIAPLFVKKKGVCAFGLSSCFWDDNLDYFWPPKKKPKTYTQKIIEACK